MRTPNPRYIGDGVYARHDGESLIVETSDGVNVTNRIAIEDKVFEGLNQYREYVRDYYRNGQHRVSSNCEKCQADLSSADNPIAGAVKGEVYHLEERGDGHIEIRLCRECARPLTSEDVQAILATRAAAGAEQPHRSDDDD